jgi:lipopolysaccharide transport system permease protein
MSSPVHAVSVRTASHARWTSAKVVMDTAGELWTYRELFYFLAWRDVKVRYKQTALGIAWAILQPFLTMVVFTLLFGKLAGMPSEGMPYPVFYFGALLPWMYFSTTLTNSGNSLVANAHLITKVYFPRLILPTAAAFSGLVDFAVGCVLLAGIMAYYRIVPDWEVMIWPLLVLLLVVLALAVGMVLAALNVRYRDVKYTLPFIVQLWLFVTPVIYPMSIIPDRYRVFVLLNPLSGIIDAFRASLVPGRQIDWALLWSSAFVTVVLFALGAVYFSRTERTFADIV